MRYVLVVIFYLWSAAWADSAVEVVVHPGTLAQPLTKAQLQAIFAMRTRTWANGASVRVFVLSDDNPMHSLFCTQRLNLLPFQLRRAWDRLVFSGIGRAPELVETEQEMRARVAETPGSIGYLPRGAIDASVYVVPAP